MILQKTSLRVELRKKRDAFLAHQAGPALRASFTRHILSFLSQYTLGPCLVFGFWPLPQEPDITQALASLWDQSYSIGLPKIVSLTSPLAFCSWRPNTPLVSSDHVTSLSLLEPRTSEVSLPPSLVLVPCLGVDAQGTRLGYGKGCYDRTLETLHRHYPQCLFIGVGFSCGLMDSLPGEPHDVRLNALITEEGFQLFSKSPSTPLPVTL